MFSITSVIPYIYMRNKDLDLSGYNLLLLLLSPFVFSIVFYCYRNMGDWIYSLVSKIFGDEEE